VQGGGGGGAGGYQNFIFQAEQNYQYHQVQYTLTVGAGGAGGAISGNNAQGTFKGTDSTFCNLRTSTNNINRWWWRWIWKWLFNQVLQVGMVYQVDQVEEEEIRASIANCSCHWWNRKYTTSKSHHKVIQEELEKPRYSVSAYQMEVEEVEQAAVGG
jgi:hypothetical protein